MPDGDTDFEVAVLYGDDVLPPPPDCTRWIPRDIQINGVFYPIVRRPRLFRFAELRNFEDPEYCDDGELPDGGNPNDVEYQDRVFVSKLWCLEFDVDIQGARKTLRVQFLWRPFRPSYSDIEHTPDMYPHGVRTYLGHSLYPVTVRMNQAQPSECEIDAPLGVWNTVHEIRYVEYKQTPFGMLPEDREEVERTAPATAADVRAAISRQIPRARRTNSSYAPVQRRSLYDAWMRYKRGGGTRMKNFLVECPSTCGAMHITNIRQLKKAIDSERKARE